jgi:hypothetical protein
MLVLANLDSMLGLYAQEVFLPHVLHPGPIQEDPQPRKQIGSMKKKKNCSKEEKRLNLTGQRGRPGWKIERRLMREKLGLQKGVKSTKERERKLDLDSHTVAVALKIHIKEDIQEIG